MKWCESHLQSNIFSEYPLASFLPTRQTVKKLQRLLTSEHFFIGAAAAYIDHKSIQCKYFFIGAAAAYIDHKSIQCKFLDTFHIMLRTGPSNVSLRC